MLTSGDSQQHVFVVGQRCSSARIHHGMHGPGRASAKLPASDTDGGVGRSSQTNGAGASPASPSVTPVSRSSTPVSPLSTSIDGPVSGPPSGVLGSMPLSSSGACALVEAALVASGPESTSELLAEGRVPASGVLPPSGLVLAAGGLLVWPALGRALVECAGVLASRPEAPGPASAPVSAEPGLLAPSSVHAAVQATLRVAKHQKVRLKPRAVGLRLDETRDAESATIGSPG